MRAARADGGGAVVDRLGKVGAICQLEYPAVSPFHSTAKVIDRLAEKKYIVVEEDESFCGILTPADALANPHKLVIDCITPKPPVAWDSTVVEAFSLMREHGLHVLPVFEDGRFRGVVTYQDLMSELTRWLGRLQDSVESLDQLDLLSASLSGIAHDFNNILMGIFGQIAEATRVPRTDQDIWSRMKSLEQSLSLAGEMVRQLQSFTSSGRPVEGVLDVSRAIQQNVEFFLHGSRIETHFYLQVGLKKLAMEGSRLSRVLGNLVINARQAMRDTGCLTVRASNMTIDAHSEHPVAEGSYVLIELSDTGCGIDAGSLDRIFEPFFTTKPDGNGLGLAIIRSILRDCGGGIEVSSEPGNTTFRIYLPAR
ncbi:MAG: CBS domain-containing protein [Deltaproteobacteria bacterium]|nr:CBS domain-containing protein [Deltaproteobacteria bacterium]